jgi:hypothetical protein
VERERWRVEDVEHEAHGGTDPPTHADAGTTACGSDEEDKGPVAEPSSSSQEKASTPTPSPAPESSAEPKDETTSEPEPEPAPLPLNFGTPDDIREFFDDELDDISWEEAPTPRGRQRLLGTVPETFATIELFSKRGVVDEIAYQVVFEGTDMNINFDRALPMIRAAQEYASEKAAMFVGSQLDEFTYLDAVPQQSNTKRFDGVFVRVLGIDLVNVVNLILSIGHPPTRP